MKYRYQWHNFEMPFAPLRILSEYQAEVLVTEEPNKWNVVSIVSFPNGYEEEIWDKVSQTFFKQKHNWPKFRGAKSFCQQYFHDIDRETEDRILCTRDHLWEIIKFGRKAQGKPLLVHCHAGISRSTAVAFLLVLDAIKDKSEQPADDALSIIYNVRRECQPNAHIIKLGIPLLARGEVEEVRWFRELYNSTSMEKIRRDAR